MSEMKCKDNSKSISLEEVIKIKNRYAHELLKIPGVIGIGIGGSHNSYKIIVNVIKLTEEIKSKIPKELDGIPIEITEVGVVEALGDKE